MKHIVKKVKKRRKSFGKRFLQLSHKIKDNIYESNPLIAFLDKLGREQKG